MIPNLVKGRGVSGALRYSIGQGNDAETGRRKMLAEGESSRAELLGGQNFGFAVDSDDRLDLARRMMEWNALPENQASRGRKCELDCLHASLSWGDGEEPDREAMTAAARDFLKSMGMEGAQAVFIAHNDTDHRHLHIIASRIDPATGKTYSQEDDFARAQAWGLQYERVHGIASTNEARQNLHKIVDAIEARDGAAIVEHLTARNPTFSARELDKMLAYGGLAKDERAAFRAEILASDHVVGLRETADAEVTRYTTRAVLAAEMGLQRSAAHLADDRTHGIASHRLASIAAEYTLKPEQAEALSHLAGPEGFGILWGEAGTGKSHTLKAVRAAYEVEGHKVIGLSWTNDVVQQMRGDGFKHADTIARQLGAIEDGRTAWNSKTVLIVDEAAMVSTDNLARLAAAANKAGAKLILAGDDAQLSSIERGGMFETLRQTHGAAVLNEVQRVADREQKAAFNQMHKGEFRAPLETFDKAGAIHWTQKQTDALRDMAARYDAAVAQEADKRRFMFAFTNAEVAALNQHARALHKGRGELGEDRTLATSHGAAVFATGDRIQFTGNGYGKSARDAGMTNGRVGTITAIDDKDGAPRVTVSLDVAKGKAPQQVSFVVGDDGRAGEFDRFKHGYAGTIYRGQGRTLDESYVCHSNLWRSSAAYVALTRHREAVHIFAARETVADLDAMAAGLARPENKRAATAYQLDERGEALRDELAAMLSADRGGEGVKAKSAARDQASPAAEPQQGSDAGHTAEQIAAGAAQVAEGIAELAGKAIETLADTLAGLLGGGSTAPATPAAPEPRAPDTVKPQPDTALEARRAKFLHDYGLDVPDEQQRDIEIERGRGRERRRGE